MRQKAVRVSQNIARDNLRSQVLFEPTRNFLGIPDVVVNVSFPVRPNPINYSSSIQKTTSEPKSSSDRRRCANSSPMKTCLIQTNVEITVAIEIVLSEIEITVAVEPSKPTSDNKVGPRNGAKSAFMATEEHVTKLSPRNGAKSAFMATEEHVTKLSPRNGAKSAFMAKEEHVTKLSPRNGAKSAETEHESTHK